MVSSPQPTTTICSCLQTFASTSGKLHGIQTQYQYNNRERDAGGLKAWSTVTICLFFYIKHNHRFHSTHGMHATELSSFQAFLGKHFIHCNKLLQLRHPAIQLPTSSLASQLSLCLTKKQLPRQDYNTVWLKSIRQSLK